MFPVFQWISQFYTINPLIYFNILSAAQDHIRTNIYNMYVCVCVCVCVYNPQRERDGEQSQNVNGDTTVFSIHV